MLVGTRALLGEGWNCQPLNVLVDMTIATTGVSVQQMRGRSLRLDPADPQKVASNWDVVCVAPDLVRGTGDYERFVRKHLHLFAPAEDGEVEAGPSHVHPELGPFTPPPVERFAALNAEQLARSADRDAARERWLIGTPYRGVELPTLLVRRAGDATEPIPVQPGEGRPLHLSQRVPIASGLGGAAAFGLLGVATSAPPLLAGLALAPGRADLGRRAPARSEEAAAARAPARRRRALRRRGLPRPRRADAGGRDVADDRAARGRLPALRAGRGDGRRGTRSSLPRSTSCWASPTRRATSSRGRSPIRAAARSGCSAAC